VTSRHLAATAGGGIAVLTAVLLLAVSEPDYSKIPVQSVEDLARELERMRERLDIPGLAAAVATDGRVVLSRGFGRADLERGTSVDPETTSFHLASVTKPYAATVVLQLADEGRLRLDAPVSEFGVQLTRSEPVRVWHLLSHTSGEPPGHFYRYDARAFGHLTTVVERVTARPFAAELTDRIVRKLELTHTGPNPRDVDLAACRAQAVLRFMGLCGAGRGDTPGIAFAASGLDRRALEAGLATGHARAWGRQLWPAGIFGPMRPEPQLTELFASAGLVASAADVVRFSVGLDQGRLLSSSTLSRAFTPTIGPADHLPVFGLGWFVQNVRGHSIAWQFGQAFESSSLIVKIPQRRSTFVVLANSDGLSRRRALGDHGDVLRSPAANLFLTWFLSGAKP
jgi:CubicO group peptidase (beta-lactamase class C family)